MLALSNELGYTNAYLSDVERGRRFPFEYEKIQQAAAFLRLSNAETTMLYDYAGVSRNTIAPDIEAYIRSTPYLPRLLRKLRDAHVSKQDWLEFAAMLKDAHNGHPDEEVVP